MRNLVLLLIIIPLFSLLASDLGAKKVYTWTDKEGNLHMTDEPPPEGAKIDNVIDYQPQPDEEVRKIDQPREKEQKEGVSQEQLQEAKEARAKADKAIEEAKNVEAEAAETIRQSQQYIDTHDRNRYMRRAHKYKLRKAQADIQAAQERARLAVEKARKAEEEARLAEERLKDHETSEAQ